MGNGAECARQIGVKMRILLAQLGDAAAILRLQKVAYQTEARLYGDDIPPLQQTLAELEREFGHFLILKAVGNGEVVGSVRARRDGGTCHLGRLIVKPELQGRGLGTLLCNRSRADAPMLRGLSYLPATAAWGISDCIVDWVTPSCGVRSSVLAYALSILRN